MDCQLSVTPFKAHDLQALQYQQTVKKAQTSSNLIQPNLAMTINKRKLNYKQSDCNKQQVFVPNQLKKFKKLWSKEQDSLLISLVQTYGAKDWGLISNNFQSRCGKQCRQRWHNHLRFGIKKCEWTNYQQWILFLGVSAYGKRWSLISKILPERTENTIKNHWNCKMKPLKSKLQLKMKDFLQKDFYNQHNLSQKQRILLCTIYQKQILCNTNQNQDKNVQKLKFIFQNSLREFQETKELIFGNSQESMDIQPISQNSQFNDFQVKMQYGSPEEEHFQNDIIKDSGLLQLFQTNKINYFDGSPQQQ